MELGLEGRVALVMGASQGIGRAVAAALAREGARVALASRSLERCREAADAIAGDALAFAADTADVERMGKLVGEVARELGGPVDVLVTNTGGPPPGRALDADVAAWESAYRSLVLAPRLLVAAALPAMRERKWGRIVNVGSTSTVEPIPTLALSNVHRPAAVGFFKTMAREVARDGVTVNTIAPGRFATERQADAHGSLDAARKRAREDVPAGRLGEVEEFGDLAAFLCSDRAAYLTGAVIPLDGGLLRSI